ncbi:hypothetical protein BTA51_14155 [Hahella sp. CCB-MM4]|uniref:hypothetical protein n=1 Tax=Hahella sp. (strain CCB-MM4) TaxID=1926491 RepID=UPI000B9A1D24|nr:hypothetical protein [Hahella sp. CCB-MM4]OZG72668.1 hypothetical protein BTA51_14155 [Hahella sp. CCB-MM4]
MKYIFFICLSLILAGCKVTVDDTDHRIRITQFNMEDSYGHWYDLSDRNIAKGVNATIHGGEFDVEWTTEPYRSEYYASLRLSHDRYGHDSIRIWDDICGETGSECARHTDISCRFTMDLLMSCGWVGEPYPKNSEVYVGDMVDYLPQRFYLVLETCERDVSSCDSEYHLIELQ